MFDELFKGMQRWVLSQEAEGVSLSEVIAKIRDGKDMTILQAVNLLEMIRPSYPGLVWVSVDDEKSR